MHETPDTRHQTLPLSAFPGFGVARRALLCTLVDPSLRGVILSGPVGTGKSALMRSFGAFVHDQVDPDAPFVQVPLGVTDDRLIGGLDIDHSIATGRREFKRGLLAEADGGILFVDDLPLLDELAIATIFSSLESETIHLEREGISRSDASRFVLVATMLPAERDLSLSLADRVAFLIGHERRLSPEAVSRLFRSLDALARDPVRFHRLYDPHERRIAESVATARSIYTMIAVGELVTRQLLEASERLRVTGNRAEVFAAKAARAHAALRGSRSIEEEDITFAVATVLAPRAENIAEDEARNDERQESETEERRDEEHTAEQSRGGEPQRDVARGDQSESGSGDGESGSSGEAMGAKRRDEQVLDPVDFNAPLAPLDEFFRASRSVEAGGRGGSDQWLRGRHTRSIQTEARGRQVAIGATMRAAAPYQKERGRTDRVIVRKEDIRVKKFTERAGTLFVFCVDASGSMAMNRMRETKGAVARLLQDAYVNRDSVALIAFRGADAELLLPPTSSVERAKRSLDVLPTGGGTPLASALMKAYAIVESSRRKGNEQVLVVLLTDGRANVPMKENAAGMIMEVRRQHVRDELDQVAIAYRRAGIATLVIDTRNTFGDTSEARRLSELLDARYYFLPRIDARGLADVVREEARNQ